MNVQLPLFDERDDIYTKSRLYYQRNPELLEAHVRAARVMEHYNRKVSARFLTEFARWLRFLGWQGMYELLDCYRGVVVRGEDVAAIPNHTSAYLTRYLESQGVNVTKSKSRMDEVMGRG